MLPASSRTRRATRPAVSILTRPGGRVLPQQRRQRRQTHTRRFNPHPARRPGAAADDARVVGDRQRPVSILTRPGGRVLQHRTFESVVVVPEVSILTRPGGRVLRGDWAEGVDDRILVSILTRPGGRVLPTVAAAEDCLAAAFQSSPGPEAGCCVKPTIRLLEMIGFQSSPGPEAGCCLPRSGAADQRRHVSILTRPGGRVLRDEAAQVPDEIERFQSSPGPEAGCCPTAGGQLPGP